MKYAFSVKLPWPDKAQLAKKLGERWGLGIGLMAGVGGH